MRLGCGGVQNIAGVVPRWGAKRQWVPDPRSDRQSQRVRIQGHIMVHYFAGFTRVAKVGSGVPRFVCGIGQHDQRLITLSLKDVVVRDKPVQGNGNQADHKNAGE